MYLHQEKKMVYLAHPKTASHSTVDALTRVGFEPQFPDEGHHAPFHEQRLLKRYKWPPRENWLVFTTIRNHWDWAVSLAFARRKFQRRNIPDTEWSVEMFKTVLRPCYYIEENKLFGLHAPHADIIIKFEHLEDDLNFVLSQRDLGPVELQHLRPTVWREKQSYREYYTDETRNYIAERFKGEIEEYGYEF
jgi:hypothetical protein